MILGESSVPSFKLILHIRLDGISRSCNIEIEMICELRYIRVYWDLFASWS